jgi:DNA repair protein RadC
MIAVLLNGKLGFNGYSEVAKGGAGFVEIALPLVFRAAIYTSSPQLILIHNHPSGDSTPSREDVVFTDKVAEVGKILGICFGHAGLMPSIT